MIILSFLRTINIPPLESMDMGCPVAVSRVYAMPWQVGEAGLTFDPKSVDEITDTLEKLWLDDDLCKTLAEKEKNVQRISRRKSSTRDFKKQLQKR